eukprot:1000597-Rhodomonas_salina.1
MPVVGIEDNGDWIVEAGTLTQANGLMNMVDSLTRSTLRVTAVQILEKVWDLESDKDRLAGIEAFTQKLSFARKSRCQHCKSTHKYPMSGSLEGRDE